MLNLTPHHRLHVPNGLAVLAAVLLLISSYAGYQSGHDADASGINSVPSATVNSDDNDKVNNAVTNKRRGLNLGLLLFRRG
jgi:hypothetical protein